MLRRLLGPVLGVFKHAATISVSKTLSHIYYVYQFLYTISHYLVHSERYKDRYQLNSFLPYFQQ